MSQRFYRAFIILCCSFWGMLVASAGDYFVSPDGVDTNAGDMAHPFATLARAAQAVQPGDTCYLRAGTYRETLRPVRSGTLAAPITFASYDGETAVISGADILDDWHPAEGGAVSAEMGWTLGDGNQFFMNGEMLHEATWPALGPEPLFRPARATVKSGSATTLICDAIPGGQDSWQGAQLWCAGGAAWICWTSGVTGYDAATHTLTFDKAQDSWYTPKAGNLFVLRGIRQALTTPVQWWYDAAAKKLLVIPTAGSAEGLKIEAKRRLDAIDLSDRAYISVRGLHVVAAGIRTDGKSHDLIFDRLKGRFVSHSYHEPKMAGPGVQLNGRDILLSNSDLAYSSTAVVAVNGDDIRVINCLIQYGGYAGMWRGTVALSGRRIVFSHNTVRHAGRDLINTGGLMESLVQYNDVSEAGWLTRDLGMFYGHNTDFANTQFCYNTVHDNHAAHVGMGIYFDHLSHNAIVHHNRVWNVDMDPIRFNNPGYNNLVFNNSAWRTGRVGTFDHSKRNDLFACRYTNNIFNDKVSLPPHVVATDNLIAKDPPYLDPQSGDFRLQPAAGGQQAGAVGPGTEAPPTGCNFDSPPDPMPVYVAAQVPWMNAVRNACFEFGSLEGWAMTDAGTAKLTPGNGWGNGYGRGEVLPTGTSKAELRLGPGTDGVEQVVAGLTPETGYILSVWVKADQGESVTVKVDNAGAPAVEAVAAEAQWARISLQFRTGAAAHSAKISITKQDGAGYAWCDNLTLPLVPPAQ